MEALQEWASKQGAVWPSLKPEGRSVYTAAELAPGDLLMQIPSDLLLTVDKAFQVRPFCDVFQTLSQDGASERTLLCLFLAIEKAKGVKSFWWPYIQSLPQTFTTPLWFNEEERTALGRSRVAASLDAEKNALKSLVQKWGRSFLDQASKSLGEADAFGRPVTFSGDLKSEVQGAGDRLGDVTEDLKGKDEDPPGEVPEHPKCQDEARPGDILEDPSEVDKMEKCVRDMELACDAVSEEILRWARSVVFSRAFTLRWGERHVIALVPMFDMLDHSPTARLTWLTDEEKGVIKFSTDAPVASGVPVYNNYGQKPNEELLQGYGFCLPNNPAECFVVKLGFGSHRFEVVARIDPGSDCEEERDENTFIWRKALLDRLGVSKEHKLSVREPLPRAFLDAARILAMPERTAYACLLKLDVRVETGLCEGAGSKEDAIPQYPYLELKVVRTLRELLSQELSKLPGGSEENDRKLIEQAAMERGRCSEAMKWVVLYRLGQKQVLNTVIRALDKMAADVVARSSPVVSELPQYSPEPGYSSWCAERGVQSLAFQEIWPTNGPDLVKGECPIFDGHSALPVLRMTRDASTGDSLAYIPRQALLTGEWPWEFYMLLKESMAEREKWKRRNLKRKRGEEDGSEDSDPLEPSDCSKKRSESAQEPSDCSERRSESAQEPSDCSERSSGSAQEPSDCSGSEQEPETLHVDVLQVFDKLSVMPSEVSLAITLMWERALGAQSKHKAFIDMLVALPETAVSWDEDSLDRLGSLCLHNTVANRLSDGNEWHEEFGLEEAAYSLPSPFYEAFSEERFLWALRTVDRYAVRVQQSVRTSRLVLAPILCLLPPAFVGSAVNLRWGIPPTPNPKPSELANEKTSNIRPSISGETVIERLLIANASDVLTSQGVYIEAGCALKAGTLLLNPLEGLDVETRLLDFGCDSGPTLTSSDGIHVANNVIHTADDDIQRSPEDLCMLGIGISDEQPLRVERGKLWTALGCGGEHYLGGHVQPSRLIEAVSVAALAAGKGQRFKNEKPNAVLAAFDTWQAASQSNARHEGTDEARELVAEREKQVEKTKADLDAAIESYRTFVRTNSKVYKKALVGATDLVEGVCERLPGDREEDERMWKETRLRIDATLAELGATTQGSVERKMSLMKLKAQKVLAAVYAYRITEKTILDSWLQDLKERTVLLKQETSPRKKKKKKKRLREG